MAESVVFGDAEAAVVDMLRVGIPGVAVATDLIGYQRGASWVRVTRTGGLPILWMQLDNPIIALDVYGPDKGAAHDTATAARAAVFAQRGQYAGRGLRLVDVGDAEGLTWAADEPASAHYTLSLSLITRPSA